MKTRIVLLAVLAAMFVAALSGPATAQQQPNYYTAYGDSITYGYGAVGLPYASLYSWQASVDTEKTLTLVNNGVPGWKSDQWLAQLRNYRSYYGTENRNSRAITLFVGFNDLYVPRQLKYKTGQCGGSDGQDCLRSAVSTFETSLDGILDELTATCPTSGATLTVANIYDPFVAIDKAAHTYPNDGATSDNEVYQKYIGQINDAIDESAAAHGVAVADVYSIINGENGDEDPVAKGWMQADGIHPNLYGNVAIADELHDQGAEKNCYGS